MKNESHAAKNVAAGKSRWPGQMRSIYEIVPHNFILQYCSAPVPELPFHG